MIVSTPREALWAWINERLGIPWSSDFRAIGATQGACLGAVVAYNGFTGRMCFMHSAIDNPALVDRTFLRAIFEYPFEQCKLEHIVGLVNADNDRALEINKRCGFKESLRLAGGGLSGQDLVIMTLRPEDCRWLRSKYGKEERHAAGRLSGGHVRTTADPAAATADACTAHASSECV